MKKVFSLFVVFLAAVVYAQPNIVISPQSIVVNPVSAFNVEVFTDKDTSGEARPSYEIGENISIGVRVSEAAYVYLFDVRSNGVVDQILPNKLDQNGQNNYVQAGQTKYFPPPNAGYNFTVDGPQGLDKVIAVASKEPLDTRQLADFRADPNFASSTIGESGFASTLSIIVTPIAQNSWTTDTALFYVGAKPAVPVYGTLSISSSPAGAEAYVDGQYVGQTPVRFGTRAGSHSVEVRLPGYQTYNTTVSLPGGQTQTVNAPLVQVRRTGTVTFSSNPRGARVVVDGQDYGSTPTAAITLDAGTYQARFSLPGYTDNTVTFVVSQGSNGTVNADLQPQRGSLTIQANLGGALVFINGRQQGTIPNGNGVLTISDLPAGTHELVVISPGFNTYLSEFTIRAGETTSLRVNQTGR